MDKRLSGADQSGNWPSLDEPGAANLEDEEASLDSITVADVQISVLDNNSSLFITAVYIVGSCVLHRYI